MTKPANIIADAIFPCMTSPGRAKEGAEAAIGALIAAGYAIVPRIPTDEMIDAGCDSDAYEIAVHENKTKHEELMAKYPGALKPRDTHGAAPVQTLPIVWKAMVDAALKRD